ncbi:MAG: HDOD domain-containing protein [Desulfovibrionaceae bacterium]|jgi:HD-like signal output (HDOD) protein|nr:HDOD domain-containing protein [Desulfovibrionaceae bacterium]
MNQLHGQRFLEEAARYRPELPYPPTLLRDLFAMTREESLATVDDIAEVIGRDQGLTAKILALANSAFYGLQARVASLSRAVSLLGIKEIRSLVLLLGVQSLTSGVPMPRGFALEEYWAHQLCTAVVCRLLARQVDGADPDILFTSGLLHDFGKLVAAINRPADQEAILALAEKGVLAASQAEEGYWGIEHGLVGGMVLGAWDLPAELTEPIIWHHAPALSPGHALQASVICTADILAHRHADPEHPSSSGWEPLAAQMGFDVEDLGAKAEEVLSDETLFQFLAVID